MKKSRIIFLLFLVFAFSDSCFCMKPGRSKARSQKQAQTTETKREKKGFKVRYQEHIEEIPEGKKVTVFEKIKAAVKALAWKRPVIKRTEPKSSVKEGLAADTKGKSEDEKHEIEIKKLEEAKEKAKKQKKENKFNTALNKWVDSLSPAEAKAEWQKLQGKKKPLSIAEKAEEKALEKKVEEERKRIEGELEKIRVERKKIEEARKAEEELKNKNKEEEGKKEDARKKAKEEEGKKKEALKRHKKNNTERKGSLLASGEKFKEAIDKKQSTDEIDKKRDQFINDAKLFAYKLTLNEAKKELRAMNKDEHKLGTNKESVVEFLKERIKDLEIVKEAKKEENKKLNYEIGSLYNRAGYLDPDDPKERAKQDEIFDRIGELNEEQARRLGFSSRKKLSVWVVESNKRKKEVQAIEHEKGNDRRKQTMFEASEVDFKKKTNSFVIPLTLNEAKNELEKVSKGEYNKQLDTESRKTDVIHVLEERIGELEEINRGWEEIKKKGEESTKDESEM